MQNMPLKIEKTLSKYCKFYGVTQEMYTDNDFFLKSMQSFSKLVAGYDPIRLAPGPP